ncbi:Arabinogalactan peptide 16 [Acorus gramineus]|uniref:Arabinogalactan peptide 16 n=1 Tax=Acorus gramineus TaxID=55184 RepID=A0AAV9ALH4_ACOGR|nr:Arabinogalactan peptide 16 [Acorus gramineus]
MINPSMAVFLFFITFIFSSLTYLSHGHILAPSPAASAPTSDGKMIDQGIAYVLMLIALIITYLTH